MELQLRENTMHASARLVPSALLCALLLAGCATPTSPVVTRYNPPPVGASWEVAQRNTGSYGRDVQFRMTRGDGTWQGRPVVTLRNSLGPTIMAEPANGHWHAILGPDGRPMASFSPPVGWAFPVKVGATSSTRHRMTNHATGQSIEYDFNCRVEAHEKVTVRAGTFDAFRIQCTTTIGNEETYWSSPQMGLFVKTRLVRTAASPSGAGTQEAELVSAPK